MDIDGPAGFGLGLFEFFGVHENVFSFIHLKPFYLLFGGHGDFVEFAHHLLAEFYLVGFMQKVELNAVLADGRMEFYRDGYRAELYVSDPYC